jgi:hypothetical protein
VADIQQSSGTVFFFGGGVSCWMHGIERNVIATWRTSVAASPRLPSQPK